MSIATKNWWSLELKDLRKKISQQDRENALLMVRIEDLKQQVRELEQENAHLRAMSPCYTSEE